MMPAIDHNPSDVLELLRDTQNLSILRIRDSVFSDSQQDSAKRQSDASTTSDGYENATPASLEADLAHYRVALWFVPRNLEHS